MIEEGSFGKVYLTKHAKMRKFVVVKTIEKNYLDMQPDAHSERMKIYNLLKRLKNGFLVQIYAIIDTESHIIISMEHCGGGTLFDFLRKSATGIGVPVAKAIFK